MVELARHWTAGKATLKLTNACYEKQKVLFGKDHPCTCESRILLARLYLRLGHEFGEHMKDALLYGEDLAINKVRHGDHHPETIQSMKRIVDTFKLMQKYGAAISTQIKILDAEAAEYGESTSWSKYHLADLYVAQGQLNNALQVALECHDQRILQLQNEEEDEPSLSRTSVFRLLEIIYKSLGRNEDGISHANKCLDKSRLLFGSQHPETQGAQTYLNAFNC